MPSGPADEHRPARSLPIRASISHHIGAGEPRLNNKCASEGRSISGGFIGRRHPREAHLLRTQHGRHVTFWKSDGRFPSGTLPDYVGILSAASSIHPRRPLMGGTGIPACRRTSLRGGSDALRITCEPALTEHRPDGEPDFLSPAPPHGGLAFVGDPFLRPAKLFKHLAVPRDVTKMIYNSPGAEANCPERFPQSQQRPTMARLAGPVSSLVLLHRGSSGIAVVQASSLRQAGSPHNFRGDGKGGFTYLPPV